MNFLLRKLASSSSFNRNARLAVIAVSGSGLLYATSGFELTVSISLPNGFVQGFHEHSWLTGPGTRGFPSYVSGYWPFGIISNFFSIHTLAVVYITCGACFSVMRNHAGDSPMSLFKAASIPSDDRQNKISPDVEKIPKVCPNCLGRDTIANAAATVGPAVVNLSVPQGFYGMTTGRSIGSGTIIDKDGTILTCAHVVEDFQGLRSSSKGKVAVTLQDGRTFEGTVLNADLLSDIAIVKIYSKVPLHAAKLGSSSNLRAGDWVLAIGCPLSLQNTVTAGIVSCVDRKSSDLGLGGMRREYLQTDCSINAGNSGGPLVNCDGEVVGVNIMKVLGADGLGFSVPIDSVSKIIDQFNKNGRVIRPWLGLKMVDLNDMIIAQLQERHPRFPNVKKGILVPAVTSGSPADRAGVQPGDVVVNFDGKSVGSITEIIDIIGSRIGVPVKLVVKRGKDKEISLTVVPEETSPDA